MGICEIFYSYLSIAPKILAGYYKPDQFYRADHINVRKKAEQNALRPRAMGYPESGPSGPTDPYEFIMGGAHF